MPSHDAHPENIDNNPNLLLDAFALTQGDRNASYGPFAEDYARVARTFRALTWHPDEPMAMDSVLGCVWMVTVKLGRLVYKLQSGIAYEDPATVRDDLTDAAGYINGVWECLNNPETVDEWDEVEWEDDADDSDDE